LIGGCIRRILIHLVPVNAGNVLVRQARSTSIPGRTSVYRSTVVDGLCATA